MRGKAPMSDPPDDLANLNYDLGCPGCSEISRKSLIQLIHEERLPCDFCRLPIEVAHDYPRARLLNILKELGREGIIPTKRNERA